jgi:hypothetical protein
MHALLQYVGEVVDTALSADRSPNDIHPGAVLVGWQCGFEPHVVAIVGAYGPEEIDEDEAIEIATDWLEERKWFTNGRSDPDYVVSLSAEDLQQDDA